MADQFGAFVFRDLLHFEAVGVAWSRKFGTGAEARQDPIAGHRFDQPDRGLVARHCCAFPFTRLGFGERGIGDEELARFLAFDAAGELVDIARAARREEADLGARILQRHRDIDVAAHRLVGHLEIVVGKTARHLRDIGETVLDEGDTGQRAAREHAVDRGAISGLDELVGMCR